MRKLVKNNVSWVGYLDWELETFHGDDYSIKNGSSQNAYLIEEEKTVLVDTVWTPHRFDFVENLKKDFGSFRAVKGVSFSVGKGEVLGFLGPNGAGNRLPCG